MDAATQDCSLQGIDALMVTHCVRIERQSHEAYRPLSHHHLRSSDTNMDNIRDSFSKMKKRFKHRLTGRKRKPDGTGVDPGGERADSTTSIPQPESHSVAGESYNREGDKANTDGEQVSSTDPPPQPDGPESVPTRGSDNAQEEGETGIDRGESNQRDSHTRLEIEVAVGSGRSEELEGVHPSPSTPSIPHGGKADST